MWKVEQISENDVILDFDRKLTKGEVSTILSEDLNVTNTENPFTCKIEGVDVKLFVKQITYLGNPHLIFKKRIQISKGWQNQLKEDNSFLIGLYKYKDTVIYTFFDKTNYINRITNNSSAHISTFDLLNAQRDGIFTKKDIRQNIITTVRRDKIKEFLKIKIKTKDYLSKEILLFENFKNNLNKNYHGIDCYSEMIKSNYKNKFQPEWIGFFIEYKFEEFLIKHPENTEICNFQSNKKGGDIDLDLNFNNKYFGDLKTHSNHSTAILGNDRININNALKRHSKIWYIVFNHDTQKDSERAFEVTRFWNKSQQKEDLMSYSTKMKNNITFSDLKILEINSYNIQYLSEFRQGKNSNGLPRNSKIKINKTDLSNFLIYHSVF